VLGPADGSRRAPAAYRVAAAGTACRQDPIRPSLNATIDVRGGPHEVSNEIADNEIADEIADGRRCGFGRRRRVGRRNRVGRRRGVGRRPGRGAELAGCGP